MGWRTPMAVIAFALLAGAVNAAPLAVANAERDARVMDVLDRYLDALNALDPERHVATYHFPHFRLASGELVRWDTPIEAMALLEGSVQESRARLRAALGPDWHRSEWVRREIVQADDEKVHVATRFVRLREDGSEIVAFDSLYIMTRQDGRWGIKGRSSFAP